MGMKQTQAQIRQKAYFEQQLKDRLSFLSGKGIEDARADKDPIVKRIKAGLRAVNSVGKFPPPPHDGGCTEVSFEVPITFRLG